MKNILIITLFVLLFTSCNKITGEGPIVHQERNISGFTGIDLRMPGDVYVTPGPTFDVELNAQQNILDVMETYVEGNSLIIRIKNDVSLKKHEPISIFISLPVVQSVRISGSGNINCPDSIFSTNFTTDISGSGNINLAHVKASQLNANISGSGSTRINGGDAPIALLNISGSGNFHLLNFATQTMSTTTSGSGNMFVNVANNLNATISGSGSVHYLGNPVVNSTISGSGIVKKI